MTVAEAWAELTRTDIASHYDIEPLREALTDAGHLTTPSAPQHAAPEEEPAVA